MSTSRTLLGIPRASGARVGLRAGAAVFVAAALLVMGTTAQAQQAPVNLRTAQDFALLGGSTITNTGPTTINGDIGLHPGTAVTGYSSITHNGDLYVADAVAEQAKAHLVLAYDDAASRGPVTNISEQLGGQTLAAGVYGSSTGTFAITGTLVLDGVGDPDSVFVFQVGSTLTTASASSVSLINGAQACNVFWRVGGSATLGTDSRLVGTVMALSSVTANTKARVQGRLLARNGAVTLDTNRVTVSACAAAPGPSPSPTPTVTPTPSPTPTVTPSPSPTPTVTPTPSPTPTVTPTPSPTPTVTPTPSPTVTPTPSPSSSATPSSTPTAVPTTGSTSQPGPTPSAGPTDGLTSVAGVVVEATDAPAPGATDRPAPGAPGATDGTTGGPTGEAVPVPSITGDGPPGAGAPGLVSPPTRVDAGGGGTAPSDGVAVWPFGLGVLLAALWATRLRVARDR